MAYDNKNSGVLFTKKERKSDKQPNFEGRIDVEGKEYELAGWVKMGKNGNKFISLQIREPYKKEQQPAEEPTPVSIDDIDDGLPF